MIKHIKPKKCCDFGMLTCDVPTVAKGKVVHVDLCVLDIVSAFNAASIHTIASCCGHNQIDGSVLLEDGREIVIKKR